MADYYSVDFDNFSKHTDYEYGIDMDCASSHHVHSVSEVAEITCLSVLFTVAVVVNAVLLIQQYRNVCDRSAVRFMLVNMAVVNIYCACFTVIPRAVLLGVHWYWYAGDFMCRFVMFLLSIGFWVRPFSMVGLLMAYIAEQATRRSGKTIALFFILPAWVCAVVFCLPKIIVHEVSTYNHMPTCTVEMNSWADILYMMQYRLYIVLGFIFPCLFTGILCCVYCVVGKSDRHANISYRATIPGGSINDVTTESRIGSAQESNNGSVEIMISTSTTPSSATNIQPHSFIPLILAIVYFVMVTPVAVCVTTDLLHYDICSMDLLIWLTFFSQASILVTGIIPVVWHFSRSSEV